MLRIIYFLILILCTNIYFVPAFSQTAQKSYSPKPASASLYNLGLKSYESGDTESAISYFKKAVELDPQFIDAHFNLGAIYKKKGDYIGAVSAFEKVVKLDQTDNEAIYELASCFYLQNNYSKAKIYYSAIPSNNSRFNESQAKLLDINKKLASGGGSQPVGQIAPKTQQQIAKNNSISNDQAEMLVNRLANEAVQVKKTTVEDQTIAEAVQQEALLDALAKKQPQAVNTLMGDYKVISSDFSGPTGIVKDSKNNIYIANFLKNTVEKIYPNGTREIFVDKGAINGPVGLAIDEQDNIYIANYGNGSVVKVTPEKRVVAIMTELNKPYYLYYDSASKTLFVTAQGTNSLVQINTVNVSKLPISFKN